MSIEVCIGNYGYYNEGELHDAWIELPKADEEIRDFLKENRLYDAMHEEIYISDYDGVPFGLSGLFGEGTSLDDLNLLAKVMEEMPDEAETVQQAIDCGIDSPDSVLGLMNWIVQADEIPFYGYSVDPGLFTDLDECYGYLLIEVIGGIDQLDSGTIARYVDEERFGRDLAMTDVALGDGGFIYTSDCEDFDLEELSMQECEDALVTPLEEQDEINAMTPDEVYAALKEEVGYYRPYRNEPDAGDLREERVLLALARDAEYDADAVTTLLDSRSMCGVQEVANALVRADEIPYTELDTTRYSSKEAALGAYVIDECGAESLKDTLTGYFDYKTYGSDAAQDVYLGEKGYVDALESMPREDMYTREEIEEMVGVGHGGDGGPSGARAHEAVREEDGLDLDSEALEAREVSAGILTYGYASPAHEAAR